MPEPKSNGPAFAVQVSKKIGDSIREIHNRAKHQGRGDEVIAATEEILQRLRTNPNKPGRTLVSFGRAQSGSANLCDPADQFGFCRP